MWPFAVLKALFAGGLVTVGPMVAEVGHTTDNSALVTVGIIAAVSGLLTTIVTGIFSLLAIRASRANPPELPATLGGLLITADSTISDLQADKDKLEVDNAELLRQLADMAIAAAGEEPPQPLPAPRRARRAAK